MHFRSHALAFAAANAVLHLANVFVGEGWWAFWPLAIWGIGLAAHYLVYKSRRVDAAWVEERTEDVRSKSYDRAHIDTIVGKSGEEKTK